MELIQDRALASVACGNADVGDGLREITLAPWGTVESKNGTFIVDDAGVSEMLSAFAAHGTPLPIDVEHETVNQSVPPGQRKGAVGWIEKVYADSGRAVKGLVRWEDRGREMIRTKAFPYLSPVLIVRVDDRRAVGLHSAALTVKPAIPRMERLAASQTTETKPMADGTMDTKTKSVLDEVAELLKLTVSDDAAAMLAAIRDKLKALIGDGALEIASAVRERLGLPATANRDAVIVAMTVQAADGKAATELQVMRESERLRTARELIARVSRGKINPNDKPAVEAAERLAMSDPATFEALFKNIPPIIEGGRTTPPSSRQMVVMRAQSDFDADPRHGKVTSVAAFVNDALREKGLATMSEDEKRELRVG